MADQLHRAGRRDHGDRRSAAPPAAGAGLARPGPLGLGLDADARGAVHDASGSPAGDLFTLGPPLRGRWYETTAIPEIRGQAAALARLLVGQRGARRPGSAA